MKCLIEMIEFDYLYKSVRRKLCEQVYQTYIRMATADTKRELSVMSKVNLRSSTIVQYRYLFLNICENDMKLYTISLKDRTF